MSDENNGGENLAALRSRELATKQETELELAQELARTLNRLKLAEERVHELEGRLEAKGHESGATPASIDNNSHCEQFRREYSGGPVGCQKCEATTCAVHDKVLKTASIFESSVTDHTYYMRHKLSCNSSFVIYLLSCKKCRDQYVGKTSRMMYIRHYEHKKKGTSLRKHFDICNFENFELQIIDCYETSPSILRLAEHRGSPECPCEVCERLASWEKQWIRELKPAINS